MHFISVDECGTIGKKYKNQQLSLWGVNYNKTISLAGTLHIYVGSTIFIVSIMDEYDAIQNILQWTYLNHTFYNNSNKNLQWWM